MPDFILSLTYLVDSSISGPELGYKIEFHILLVSNWLFSDELIDVLLLIHNIVYLET